MATTAPGAPGSITITSYGAVSAALGWSAPSSNGGLAIDSYVVNTYQYVPATGGYSYVGQIETCGSCTTGEVVGLSPFTYYDFVVYAHNGDGYSPGTATGPSAYTAGNQSAAGHPQAVGGEGALTVSWSVPYAATVGGLINYTVGIVPAGGSSPIQTFITTALTVTATGLVDGQSYHAQIATNYNLSAYDATVNTGNATVGQPPADALGTTGVQGSFSYDTFKVTDQVTAKVNIGSGDLVVSQRDLDLPGVGGSRSVGQDFNSLALAPSSSSAGGALLSPGWRLNAGFDVRLAFGNGVITYYDPTGGAWAFRQMSGTWAPPPGLDVTLAYSPASSLWTVVDHATRTTYSFDPAGVLVGELDRNNNPVVYSYEQQSSPGFRVTGSAGLSTANSVVAAPGPDGHLDSMSQIPGDGSAPRTTTFTYNSAGQLTSVTDAAGETTSYYYDNAGNIQDIRTPDNRYIAFFYDSSHRVVDVIQINLDNNAATSYDYSTLGHTLVTDPDRNPPIDYSIDSSMRVTGTVDAAGATTSTSWTGDSQVDHSTNQMGGTTQNTYGANPGANGNESLTATRDPTGVVNTATYGTAPACGATNPAAQYLPTTATNPLGGVATTCYDPAGNMASSTDPAAGRSSVTHYPDGNPATSTTPDNQTTGVVTDYYETPAHQLYYQGPSNYVGPDKVTVDDIFGDVAYTANYASGTYTTSSHDAMGRLLATATAATNVTYSYDTDGNLTTQNDTHGGTTTKTYDALSRLQTQTGPNGVNQEYIYDKASNLTSVIDVAGGTYIYTSYYYDTLDRVAQVIEPSGRIDLIGHNAMGQQADLWTNTGTYVTFTGTTVNPPANFATHTHATYNPNGQIAALKTTLASNDNNTFSNLYYGYGTGGNCAGQPANVSTRQIQFEYDAVRGIQNAFCYDNTGRLDAALVNGVTTLYGYDADGNPTTGALGAHSYNSADQTADPGYAYDADGNLTASPTLTATYNTGGQTTSITPPGSATTSFAYTGTGQDTRTSASAPGVTTTYANGLLGIHSQAATNIGTTSFVYLPDGHPLAESTPTGDYYYITDSQGSVIGLADPSGTPRASYTYTPYGAQTATAENGPLPPNPYGWDSGYTDTATGLIHFAARYYDPTTGRWTQLDPTGKSPGYQYAGDDPVNNVDPSGLCDFVTCITNITNAIIKDAAAAGTGAFLIGLIVCLGGVNVVCDVGGAFIAGAATIAGALFGLGQGIAEDLFG